MGPVQIRGGGKCPDLVQTPFQTPGSVPLPQPSAQHLPLPLPVPLPILIRFDNACRPDRLAQAIPQWQAKGSGYIGAMRVGSEAHDMTNSPWYEPLGVLYSKRYHMYASGGFYALSSEAVQLLTQIPMSQRRLAGGGEDASVWLWVLGYNIPYLDDRRLAGFVEKDWTTCPDNFIGEHNQNWSHCSL